MAPLSTVLFNDILHNQGLRWSPYIKCLSIARMTVDHACRTITGAEEIKRYEWWMWINGSWRREKPHEKPNQVPFRPPGNTHGVTEKRAGNPSAAVGGERLTAGTTRLPYIITIPYHIIHHTLSIYIYINKNVNVRLYIITNLRKFFTDLFEILTQRCIRTREC